MLRLTKACQIPKFKVSPGGVYVTLWQLSWGIKRIMPRALGKVHLSWRAVCHAEGVKRSPLHSITGTKSDALSRKVKPPSSNTFIHSAKRKIVLMLSTGLEALGNYFLSSSRTFFFPSLFNFQLLIALICVGTKSQAVTKCIFFHLYTLWGLCVLLQQLFPQPASKTDTAFFCKGSWEQVNL